MFSYYSGQSEEAFKLYFIGDELIEVFDSGYLFGGATSFSFDRSENMLVMAYPYSCSEWWRPWEDDDLCVDENGVKYLEFGKFHLLDISAGSFASCEIRVAVPAELNIDMGDYDPLLYPMLSEQLQLSMPWGKVKLDIPLKDSILLTYPTV